MLVSKASRVILVLSLIVFFILGYMSLGRWRSIETMQWSDMYPCLMVLVTLSSLSGCVKIRSSVFANLCVGPHTCCSNPKAITVSLKIVFSALVLSSVLIFRSPSIIRLSRLVIFSVMRSVIFSMKVAFVVWLSMLGGGWYIPIIWIGLFLWMSLQTIYSIAIVVFFQ